MNACKSVDDTNFEIRQKIEPWNILAVKWEIKYDQWDVANGINSPSFDFLKEKWHLRIFAKSCLRENKFMLSLCIQLKRENSNDKQFFDIFFKAGLRDSKGNLHCKFESNKQFHKTMLEDSSDDTDRIIWTDELTARSKEFILKKMLTVICELRAVGEVPEDRRIINSNGSTHMDKLTMDIGNLLKEDVNSDVTLNVRKQKFGAHRIILGARSTVFAAMFKHDMAPKWTLVTIEDIEPADFSVLLDYIYTAQIPEMSIEKAINVYYAADKYDLKGLKIHCREIMLSRISTDWFFKIALLAYDHNDENLKDGVKLFVGDNLKSLLSSDKCEDFLEKNLKIGLELFRTGI